MTMIEAHTLPARLLGSISQRDRRIMRRVHRWPAPRWFRVLMIGATRGGDGWLWYLCGLMVWAYGGSKWESALAEAGIASAIGLVIYDFVKHKTRRSRPCLIEAHCWARLKPPDRYSFPSGHTITAFAVAVSLSLHYPVLAPLLLSLAVIVAASRIFLGMHFLSDVVAGSLLGAALAYGTHWWMAIQGG